ncbi:hypothetical protein [Legionella rowbothamii]|uniref:hypothetical protein n=1 Tax=Legionella rowbothamii TaxID=96229 RepID=UPI0010557A5C|nr:hypothetical protein [Legionella rowbothamii]
MPSVIIKAANLYLGVELKIKTDKKGVLILILKISKKGVEISSVYGVADALVAVSEYAGGFT